MPTEQATQNSITLRGSAQIVSEFFYFSINSILYQRGIYDEECFIRQERYGLPMMITNDTELTSYLATITEKIKEWLTLGMIKKLVIIIASVEEEEVLERWVFDIQTNQDVLKSNVVVQKSRKVIVKDIRSIIRQITASVTYLPLLEQVCSFDLLVYTKTDCDVPMEWEESDPRYISKSNEVRLRSFTTKVHKIETSVAYKCDDNDDDD